MSFIPRNSPIVLLCNLSVLNVMSPIPSNEATRFSLIVKVNSASEQTEKERYLPSVVYERYSTVSFTKGEARLDSNAVCT